MYVSMSMGSQLSTALSIFNFEEESLTEPGDHGSAKLSGQWLVKSVNLPVSAGPTFMWLVGGI